MRKSEVEAASGGPLRRSEAARLDAAALEISSSIAASVHHPSPSLPWVGWGHVSRRGPLGETEMKHGNEDGHFR